MITVIKTNHAFSVDTARFVKKLHLLRGSFVVFRELLWKHYTEKCGDDHL